MKLAKHVCAACIFFLLFSPAARSQSLNQETVAKIGSKGRELHRDQESAARDDRKSQSGKRKGDLCAKNIKAGERQVEDQKHKSSEEKKEKKQKKEQKQDRAG